jgi:hypothetical protein
LVKLSSGDFPKGVGAKLSCLFGIFSIEDIFSARILEGLNHNAIIA